MNKGVLNKRLSSLPRAPPPPPVAHRPRTHRIRGGGCGGGGLCFFAARVTCTRCGRGPVDTAGVGIRRPGAALPWRRHRDTLPPSRSAAPN
ncbi:hypothetical protein EVAR_11020_1 [Eumeta japonica]|uniref:Uncharacterized protein n=1 Tax=Eumeta variegata TaxID=151549 RepID=A0A4C1YND9_EUMVA|nr:hypothetical protein EVAR_11020_1 [Eumeta japonica]